jgi:hypothetical protein
MQSRHPQESLCRQRSELCFDRAATARDDRDGDERLRIARLEALGRDDLPHQFISGPVDRDAVNRPAYEPSPPIDKERSRLDPDESLCKTHREVVRIAMVREKVIEQGIYQVSASRQGLESANLLQQGRCTGEREDERRRHRGRAISPARSSCEEVRSGSTVGSSRYRHIIIPRTTRTVDSPVRQGRVRVRKRFIGSGSVVEKRTIPRSLREDAVRTAGVTSGYTKTWQKNDSIR